MTAKAQGLTESSRPVITTAGSSCARFAAPIGSAPVEAFAAARASANGVSIAKVLTSPVQAHRRYSVGVPCISGCHSTSRSGTSGAVSAASIRSGGTWPRITSVPASVGTKAYRESAIERGSATESASSRRNRRSAGAV